MNVERVADIRSTLVDMVKVHKMEEKICRKCGVKLIADENTTSGLMNNHDYICNPCVKISRHKHYIEVQSKRDKTYRLEHPVEMRNKDAYYRYRKGGLSMEKNKQCSSFLGVHVAEKVLSKVFKNVDVMPYGHSGYDFICGKGKKIDVKASCGRDNMCGNRQWLFNIRHNKISDYFLCLAFNNRIELNPLYIWLIPANKLNNLMSARITETTINKWDEYRLETDKVVSCCNVLKGGV